MSDVWYQYRNRPIMVSFYGKYGSLKKDKQMNTTFSTKFVEVAKTGTKILNIKAFCAAFLPLLMSHLKECNGCNGYNGWHAIRLSPDALQHVSPHKARRTNNIEDYRLVLFEDNTPAVLFRRSRVTKIPTNGYAYIKNRQALIAEIKKMGDEYDKYTGIEKLDSDYVLTRIDAFPGELTRVCREAWDYGPFTTMRYLNEYLKKVEDSSQINLMDLKKIISDWLEVNEKYCIVADDDGEVK